MISVTFPKVCCQSDVSFSCCRCGYSVLVDYICLEAFLSSRQSGFFSRNCRCQVVALVSCNLKERTSCVTSYGRFHARHA